MGLKVKFLKKGRKKTKHNPNQSHYKPKNQQYPPEMWEKAFELRARNSHLGPDEKKWMLDRIAEKTGIPRSTLGHHFDDKKMTRKGKGYIAGNRSQPKVLTTGKRDFFSTKTCVTDK